MRWAGACSGHVIRTSLAVTPGDVMEQDESLSLSASWEPGATTPLRQTQGSGVSPEAEEGAPCPRTLRTFCWVWPGDSLQRSEPPHLSPDVSEGHRCGERKSPTPGLGRRGCR